MHKQHEDYDQKLSKEIIEKDKEIDELNEILLQLDQNYSQHKSQITHELSLKQQIIDALESENTEFQKRIELMESTRT